MEREQDSAPQPEGALTKRVLDLGVAIVGLVVCGPFLVVMMFLVWKEDRRSPFYLASRVGVNDREFKMVKLRSMVAGADKSSVFSTAADDQRITRIGAFVRRYHVDEITQLWNLLLGQMSLVGPRPQVRSDVDLYTQAERKLLSVRPGITDFSSIVFADEADILTGVDDPDLAYNQCIRPWKSRLGLLYITERSLWLDLRLVALTVLGVFSRERALHGVVRMLKRLGASAELVEIATRTGPPKPAPPPGSDHVVTHRREPLSS